jgi:hypothetical protein
VIVPNVLFPPVTPFTVHVTDAFGSATANCCVPPGNFSTLAGVTTRPAPGAATTLIETPPVRAPTDAVMCAIPGVNPVTTPPESDAMPGVSVVSVALTPPMALPAASPSCATTCATCPVSIWPLSASTTIIFGTGATMNVALSDFPSMLAVIDTDPACFPTAVPPPTCATDASDDDQFSGAPAIGLPSASRAVPVKVALSPRDVTPAVFGVTETDTATCFTLTAAVAVLPSASAVMMARPFPVAVTTPFALTLATAPLLLE